MIQLQYLTSSPVDHPASVPIGQRPKENAEINKTEHIEGKHVTRSDVDPANTRKWFIFVLSQSVRQSFST